MIDLINGIAAVLSDWMLIPLLLVAALWFTVSTRGVQFGMLGSMCRLLVERPAKNTHRPISSFQAFVVSIASRVGTGNLAGVATAITLGGPGAIFWMWVIALLGASSAFIESTLAQIFKIKDKDGTFRGGPAYYISRAIGSRTWAITFAILIAITFGLAYNSVQANTISEAFDTSWGIPRHFTAIALTIATVIIIWGGLRSIVRFSTIAVPFMAISYVLVALAIIILNIKDLPDIIATIIENAFGIGQAAAGSVGAAISMGIKRGLFSNEAGEGSAPNVAATADVSHPVKQGLVQALGVFTDTLLICTCTAFIILCSGIGFNSGQGIALTQLALDSQFHIPGIGTSFVSIAILFFAFTSIIGNYYYGQTNIQFISSKRGALTVYRIFVSAMVALGSILSLDVVWSLADITMSLMAACNLIAILWLGRYAMLALSDYRRQRRLGLDPRFTRHTIPSIYHLTDAWPE